MTFDDLNQTLADALGGGKVGTPVSLRLHVQLSEEGADLAAVLPVAMQMAGCLFGSSPFRLMARGAVSGPQLNLLISFRGGETLLLTLGRGSVEQSRLDLLLIGNHGVIRLEGAELFEAAVSAPSEDADRWKSSIRKSLRQNAAVELTEG